MQEREAHTSPKDLGRVVNSLNFLAEQDKEFSTKWYNVFTKRK